MLGIHAGHPSRNDILQCLGGALKGHGRGGGLQREGACHTESYVFFCWVAIFEERERMESPMQSWEREREKEEGELEGKQPQ